MTTLIIKTENGPIEIESLSLRWPNQASTIFFQYKQQIRIECLFLWESCCRDIGIEPRLVKPYFLPFDKDPDWFSPDLCQLGEAYWDEKDRPEVVVFVLDPFKEERVLIPIALIEVRHIIYHELVHTIIPEAPEGYVAWLALNVSRRRPGWQYSRSFLKATAFEQGLGPPRDNLTMFQWIKNKYKPSNKIGNFVKYNR